VHLGGEGPTRERSFNKHPSRKEILNSLTPIIGKAEKGRGKEKQGN